MVVAILLSGYKSKTVEEEVKRYIAIQYYYSKRDELAKDDPTVVNELKLYLSEQESVIEDLIRKWRMLQNVGTFVIFNGEIIEIHSSADLSNALSSIMEQAFDRTLIVNNDLLNKNILTGAIKIARKKALECVMSQNDIYNGLSYLSPEFNAVRSTLSKNGLVSNDSVKASNQINPENLNRLPNGTIAGKPIMTAINNQLQKAVGNRIALKALYEMMKDEPFGLRDGYIPILVAYALRNYQNVSLYFHGNEHSYTEEELVKALSEPENYTLYICNWNEPEIAYIEGLEAIFSNYLPKGDGLNRLEELFRAINLHYTSISKSARTTEVYVSDIAKQYRDILNISYKDYNAFFFEVLPKLNQDLQELIIQIENIKKELESVEEKQFVRVVRVVKQVFDIDDSDELMDYIQRLYRTNWEKKSQKAFDYTTNNILDLVSHSGEMTEEQFVLEIAKAATGFELSYWTDNKINDFEEVLRDTVDKLNEYDPEEGLQEGETKITIESADGIPMMMQFSQEELSPTGKTMLNKMRNTLGNFGQSVSYEEKISILTEIIKEIIG